MMEVEAASTEGKAMTRERDTNPEPSDASASSDELQTALLRKASAFPSGAGEGAEAAPAVNLRKEQVRAALFRKLEPLRVGRFILLEPLGAGAMGEIYAAYDDQLDRKVALKLVKSGGASRKGDERLLREAQTLAQVSHPNVVQIYEAGTYNGRLFIAMELVRGKTLTSWLEDAKQVPRAVRLREILRQFIAAGRGLEAAHAAGLAHRDFKPDNVLVGDDGRVRVVDFGLARALVDEPEAGEAEDAGAGERTGEGAGVPPLEGLAPPDTLASSPKLKAAVQLTETGTVMGTPRFMAPEQFRGAVADQRSDQFSFCVALYHALYDAYPFAGDSWHELRASMESGELRTAANVPVPAFVRAALRRGLSVQPAERFPNMGELLAALEPKARRLRAGIAVGAGLLAAGLGAAVYARSGAPADPCEDAGAAIDAPWSAERQGALQAAFRRSDLPFAESAWRGVKARLDEYAGRWRAEATAACRATNVARTQSAQQLDKRMLCLDRGRRQLAALVAELGTGAPAAVERAVEAAEALPALEACGDARNLLFGLEPPPALIANKVAVVRDQIARAFTVELLGRREDALALAREASAAAGGLQYPPVRAEALVQVARAIDARETAAARAEAEQLYFEALDIAEAERHDELAARIWNRLVLSAVGASTERASAWWRRNDAAVRRLGGDAYEQAKLHHMRGEIHYREGKYARAADEQKLAIAAIERVPARRIELSRYYDALAKALEKQNDVPEALRLAERALAIATESFGPGHPNVIKIQSNFARALERGGQHDRARAMLEDALKSLSPRDRESHPNAARLHGHLSELAYRAGRFDRAAEHGRATMEIYQRAKSPDHLIAEAITNLANVEIRRGNFKDALPLYEDVLALRRRSLTPNHFQLGVAEGSLAEVLVELARHDEAMVHVLEAERIFERSEARRPEYMPWILTVHGEALAGQRRFGAAIPVLERALALYGDKADDPTNHALAMGTLARALHAQGQDPDRVRSLAERAHAIFTAQGEMDAHRRVAIARFIEQLPARRAAPAK
jgi:tetratricopeptide (TPR) repeat protein